MDGNSERKFKAFVIMPFGESFDDIYGVFIVRTCEIAGFGVARADDMNNSQNILKDIIHGIIESDIVIADLTDSNSNVFYELGIAHAFCKRVILLTQDLTELPFDLKPYRVISYTSHFADMERAKNEFLELLKGFVSGKSTFGGPISDFAPDLCRPFDFNEDEKQIAEREPGLIDNLVSMEEGFEKLTEIMVSMTNEMKEYSEKTNELTSRIQLINAQPDSSSARKLRANFVDFAQFINKYSKSMYNHNNGYSEVLTNTRAGLEGFVKSQGLESEKEIAELKQFMDILNPIESQCKATIESLDFLIETIENIRATERSYDRAREELGREILRYRDNMEQTGAMIARVREIGESRIKRNEQKNVN
jgi:hypothetical protein